MPEPELTISRQTLTDFVSGLAAATPAPGSGAAGAVALALAAGCAGKAFAVSNKHSTSIDLEKALEQTRSIARIALESAQRDGDDFRAWLKSHSSGTVAALEENARILFSLSCELERLLTDNRSHIIASLEADILCARDLIAAFKAIEARNRDAIRG
jgi:hypothetical protein